MLRPLLRASAACAFALLIAPAAPSAAPPPGVAYDEIVRVVASGTPPPPGSFQTDLAALSSGAGASPTPAPKKRGGVLGSIGSIVNAAGSITGVGTNTITGSIAGQVIANAIQNAVAGALSAQFAGLAASAQSFLTPHLMRYAYWNGWERVDDVTARTAIIRKCDAGQVIHLDLAAKTYTLYDPSAEPTPSTAPAPPQGRGRGAPPPAAPSQPGTAVATLTEATKPLGAMRIENTPTTGFDTSTTFAVSQSTGSCKDGGTTIDTVQYVSNIQRPTVTSCPIHREPLPTTASEAVTIPSGGCRPTFTANRSGPVPPSNKLALYSLVSFGASNGGAPAPGASGGPVGFLTERGNLKVLGAADAGTFSIPPDFTKAP